MSYPYDVDNIPLVFQDYVSVQQDEQRVQNHQLVQEQEHLIQQVQSVQKNPGFQPMNATHQDSSRKRKVKTEGSPIAVTKKRTKADTKVYQCEHCERVFHKEFKMNSHIKTHFRNTTKEFSCSQYNKSFDRRGDLVRHDSSVHYLERLQACTMCFSKFSCTDNLTRYIVKIMKIKIRQ